MAALAPVRRFTHGPLRPWAGFSGAVVAVSITYLPMGVRLADPREGAYYPRAAGTVKPSSVWSHFPLAGTVRPSIQSDVRRNHP